MSSIKAGNNQLNGLALASLSGESDARWALAREDWIDMAFLGGLSLDRPALKAARAMVKRGRNEFLTENPFQWIRAQFKELDKKNLVPAVNVRVTTPESITEAASVVSEFDGILEINAHCRQPEMVEAGCGHALLRDESRLLEYLSVAVDSGVTVSLKARFEVPGADTVSILNKAAKLGCDYLHVDTMDSLNLLEHVDGGTIIANNGIRKPEDLIELTKYGTDYASVARGDSPDVLKSLRSYIDTAMIQSD